MTSSQTRKDELDSSYQRINQLDGWLSFLFWLNIFLSVAVLYADPLLPQNLRPFPTIVFAVSVVVYFVLSQQLRFHHIPRAEKLRRRVMLSNAFGANLTPEKTNLYYNNVVKPSITRLGANTLENAFFAKHVCEKMAERERVMVGIYLAVYIAATFILHHPDFLLLLVQILFTSELLVKSFHLERLRLKNERIYEDLYSVFANGVNTNTEIGVATVLDAFTTYECAKAEANIKQSSKIFNQLNERLTKEWNDIAKALNLQ